MKTKISNALIIKNFDQEPFYGDVIIEDNIITYVGESTNSSADKIIDANKNIIMPGFVNAHAHSAMEIFKGLSGGKTLQNWLYDMQKHEAKLSGADVYNATLFACLEYAKNGITTVNENYFFADYSAKAFNDAGIRAVVSVSQRYSPKKFLKEEQLETLYKNISNMSSIITSNFYCHSIYNCDENMFATINKLASKHSSFVSTHASETLEEVGRCASQNDDLSPIGLLEEYGFFDRKSLAIHCTNVDENDILIMAKNNASICANFGSNFKLASGIAPVTQMKKYGINICLGTDGSASNNRLDMFREMYLASTSQNILLSVANTLTAKDVLKMATINGAKALNLSNIGEIKEGYCADLIMLDKKGVNGLICNDLYDNLVYSYGVEDILLTMVNGKVIYDGKKYYFNKSKKYIDGKILEIQNKLLK